MGERCAAMPTSAIGEFAPGRKISAVSMESHPSPLARAALRCGLYDATIIADQVAKMVERENTSRGRLTKKGVEHVALVKRVADLIWQTFGEIEVPRG